MKHKVTTRRNAIKSLIKQYPVEDQLSLVTLIKQRHNMDTSQAIVSRDLRALGVVKRTVHNKMIYDLPQIDASQEILRLAIVSITHNEALVVINTLPGLANVVGDYLDMLEQPDILGVLAGENVVFVTPRSIYTIEDVYKKICERMHLKTNLYKDHPHETPQI